MNTEAIKEIAKQLGIAANAVTKDVIPAYTSYMITSKISIIIALAFAIITLLTLGRFFIFKSKECADWQNKKLTQYQRNEMRDNYEDCVLAGITLLRLQHRSRNRFTDCICARDSLDFISLWCLSQSLNATLKITCC